VGVRAGGGPVGKVIQLLGNLQAKVIQQGEEQAATFEKFSRFCERQSTEKSYSIEDAHEVINEQNAVIDNAKSNLEQIEAKIQAASAKITELETDVKESKAQRDEEHKDFLKRDEDLAKTIDMLTRARAVIEKKLSGAKRVDGSLIRVASTMKAVVDASFVTLEDKEVIATLLQEGAGDDGDDNNEGAGPILKTFENLKDKAVGSRNEGQQEELRKEGDFKTFIQATEDEIRANSEMLDASKKAKNKNLETLANAQATLEDAEKDLQSDEKALSDLQRECMDKAAEFETSQRERSAELKVLAQAKSILAGPADNELAQTGSSFIQVKSRMNAEAPLSFVQVEPGSDFQRQLQAAAWLSSAGQQLNSWVLSQVGEHVRADPFNKVKRMIEEMVAKLMSEQEGEAQHKEWCDKEITETQRSLQNKNDKLDDVTTFVDKQQAMATKLGDEITTLMKEIGQIDEAVQQATQMRQTEHEDFLKASKQQDAGQKACAMAIKVLRSYYDGGSFVQRSTQEMTERGFLQAMQRASAPAGNKGSASSSIIGLLEVAESDFSKELAEATAAEEAAQKEFEQMVEDARLEKATKQNDVKNKKSEKLRVDNLVSEGQVDVSEAQKDVSAAEGYMDKLKASCTSKVPSFEQRQQRRQQELESLQNALGILEGKSIGFVQA